MDLSLNWLKEYVDIDTGRDTEKVKEYCERLTRSGSKVEGFTMAGDEISNVVVCRMLSIEKHPDAERLSVCMVDIGAEEPLQIVTAATNMKVGDLVPVALDGSVLADGTKIKKGKLRGVVSNGMFCSIAELGLTLNDVPYAEEDGLLIIAEDCKPGDDIRDVYMMKDTVVEFEITPNRPDCLSVIGLARESAATYGLPLKVSEPVCKGTADNISDYVSVEVKAPDLCSRYTARAVKNVKIAPSPLWLRARLRAMGIRPINNIVDITNYVMLEYGQPMHAFDRRDLEGGKIIVRRAENGESLTTLDGVDHKLNDSMLMICDAVKPVGVAGVMGGENSEIKNDTTTVIFESAVFDRASVRLTARALATRTESSSRFEKGLDTDTPEKAINRACELVELLGAGEVVCGMIDIRSEEKDSVKVEFDPDGINAFLGTNVCACEMKKILASLDIKLVSENGKEYAIAPKYRTDIENKADIAEEIARMYGYDKIEATAFRGGAKVGRRNERQEFVRQLEELCVSLGLYEVMTYSFISPKIYDKLGFAADDARRNCVVITNPLGEDTSVMRTTAAGSMLEIVAHNMSYRNDNGAFYENARVYAPCEDTDTKAKEAQQLLIGIYGEGKDFYTIKGICEAIALKTSENYVSASSAKREYEIRRESDTYLHPGRSAALYKNGKRLMIFGEVHPDASEAFGIDRKAYIALIDTDALFEMRRGEPAFKPLPKFPAVSRDLAFVCASDIEIGAIEAVISEVAGAKLETVRLFDVYTGKQLGEGKKSLAFSLVLRDYNKTMTDEDADKITSKIIKACQEKLGAELRS